MSSVKLYVGNLSFSTTADHLSDLFGQVGGVVSSTVITDQFTGQSRGFGFIEMEGEDQANIAIERFNGGQLDGRQIVVNKARPRAEGGRGGDGGGRRGGGGGSRRPGGGGGNRGFGGGGGGSRNRW